MKKINWSFNYRKGDWVVIIIGILLCKNFIEGEYLNAILNALILIWNEIAQLRDKICENKLN
ncbi:hypothetical protein [Bacillus xiapuensis]|uniref:Uncharacterized protein n=1 Tax=Bacillus xiapuensis TaxID=2014075 RepID=A0ABU6NCE0_9BACI|nr:hypothetical protein [Bacillus xiapuensis]